MKILITACLSFIYAISFAQSDTAISFSGVVQVESVSKEELFTRARNWFANVFVNSKEVLQVNDKESGELTGKGILLGVQEYRYMGNRKEDVRLPCTITIRVKDGRYKYEFKNISVEFIKGEATLSTLTSATECPDKWAMVGKKHMNDQWAAAKITAKRSVDEKIKSLELAMSKKSDNEF